jgi:hypothetical protein
MTLEFPEVANARPMCPPVDAALARMTASRKRRRGERLGALELFEPL